MLRAYASDRKRDALVRAAQGLLHERGFERTTLAVVAKRAAMPLGNVYYYFKSKEALAEAAIASHERLLRVRFAEWARQYEDPRKRLRRLVLAPLEAAENVIQFGCPHGSLCQELEKLGAHAPLAKAGARLLDAYVSWSTQQFRLLGCGREARPLAAELVAALQGTMLIAHTMRSRELLDRQLRRIAHGLDAVARSPTIVAGSR